MASMLKYDIEIPENVEHILSQDLWVSDQFTAQLLVSVTDPIKFSTYTSVFVKKGECQCELDLIKYTIKAPCVLGIKENQILQKLYVSDDFEVSFMVMSKRLTDSIFTLINTSSIFPLLNRTPVLNLLPEDIMSLNVFYEYVRDLISRNDKVYGYQTLIYSMAAFFYRDVTRYFSRIDDAFYTTQGRMSDRFISLVQKNFRSERFLDFYANEMSITPKHLSRTVKQQTGFTAVEWIERFVILEAKVMLRSSNMTIQQIADELNFPSQSFFGKYFKKSVGVSPKEYRNTSSADPVAE